MVTGTAITITRAAGSAAPRCTYSPALQVIDAHTEPSSHVPLPKITRINVNKFCVYSQEFFVTLVYA